jgi:protein SCO1/2
MRISILQILVLLVFNFFFTFQCIAAESLYDLNGILQDQNNNSFTLKTFENKAVLLLIGYSQCPSMCPMIVSQMKALEKELNQKNISQDKLKILFLSIDPDDSPKKLLAFAQKHNLNLNRWTLAQTNLAFKKIVISKLGLNFDEGVLNDHIRHSYSLVLISNTGENLKLFPNILKFDLKETSSSISTYYENTSRTQR